MASFRQDEVINLQEKYEKVRKLMEEEYKKDPETEPYRSKYKAKSILSDMKSVLVNLLDEASEDEKLKTMLGVIWLHLGTISLDTEELSTGEEQLTKCLEILSHNYLSPDNIIIAIAALNQLGILWSQRTQSSKAKFHLEQAEDLYKEFVKTCKIPKSIHSAFNSNEEVNSEKELEKLHTLTKFYLAQVYGALKDLLKSARYCHETLRRQLENKEYEAIDWALNSATLSQFFMERIKFKHARHHLAAASYVLDKYEDELKLLEISEEEMEAKKEELKHRSADVSRCWSKYGIFLLEYSKNLNETSCEEDFEDLFFDSLELSVYENQMTDKPVILFEDAREIFLATQKHLNQAKEYYCLEDHASDYVEIVQDHSQLFQHLIEFENNEERQCKMHKKRIDLLESVLKELNVQYYLLACRKLWFELGGIYHDLMDIKYKKVQDTQDCPNPNAFKKINHLIEQSMIHFNSFLDSLKDRSSKKLPEVLNEELIRPTLVAHLHMGRLLHKAITVDKRAQLQNTLKSLECYKYLVDYCDAHPEAKECVKLEYDVSKEMVELLSLKIHQITGSNVL